MKSLYSYIKDINGSELQDLTDYILASVQSLSGSAKDIITAIKVAREQHKDAKRIKNEENVERILLELLEDPEFYDAVINNSNEYDVRRLLKRKLKRSDVKYIPDIIKYLDVVRSK